jgi:hypothetical protein
MSMMLTSYSNLFLLSYTQDAALALIFVKAHSLAKHEGSLWATFIGGTAEVLLTLFVNLLEGRWKGPVGMVSAIGTDIFIDGLVLGLAFLAGENPRRPPFKHGMSPTKATTHSGPKSEPHGRTATAKGCH